MVEKHNLKHQHDQMTEWTILFIFIREAKCFILTENFERTYLIFHMRVIIYVLRQYMFMKQRL
jgi:hypothetical protein